ncbi:MAG: hypothetical protein C5B50_06215 [Verrucomicrobia bacterium]|nr:MAG: hypothetical protein C5B50_06215 [Verrucomicrobiota bacterium]
MIWIREPGGFSGHGVKFHIGTNNMRAWNAVFADKRLDHGARTDLASAVPPQLVGGLANSSDAVRQLYFETGRGRHLLDVSENMAGLEIKLRISHNIGPRLDTRERINAQYCVIGHAHDILPG